jgi:dolichol-phosphate mannosyltransferase
LLEKHKIYFVIPVYNEGLNIPRILGDLELFAEIVAPVSSETHFLFVDDGSTDDTSAQLRAAGRGDLLLLEHGSNRGPGTAFQTAFSHLLAQGLADQDLVITTEGDATSDPDVLRRMIHRLAEGDDIVLASPYLYGGGFSQVKSHRVFISHVANFLIKLILDLRGLATFSCFYRVYRGTALIRLNLAYPGQIVVNSGFECAAEILVKAVRIRLAISEVPFKVDWDRRKGQSKMKIMRTTVDYLRMYWQLGFGRGRPLTHEDSDHRRG